MPAADELPPVETETTELAEVAGVTEVRQGDRVLARHIPADAAFGQGLKFFSSDGDFQQVGTWGYDAGKQLAAHRHNPVERRVGWTQEVLFVRRGRLLATVYDLADRPAAEFTVAAGDVLVLLDGGHGYRILDDGTQVLEVKNGPYPGADADRRRL